MFDPRQVSKHPYQSLPAFEFMLESLEDLQRDLQEQDGNLHLYDGLPHEVIRQLVEQLGIEAVFVNRDYTPFSRRRDEEIAELCRTMGIDFHVSPDCLLLEPEQALKHDGTAYKVFTPFYNNARHFKVAVPQSLNKPRFVPANPATPSLQGMFPEIFTKKGVRNGGRKMAMRLLDGLGKYGNYGEERDFPGLSATTGLSVHLKFGTCSVREAYYAIVQNLGSEHPLLRQLYWRDFFTHIAFNFPHVFGKPFHLHFDVLAWANDFELFTVWSEGRTGFPIVDAGMRQLNETGFMHNRVRMIVASFLTKDLHISWRWGERYFAQRLVDYDPAINNGNWQWAASTGCDAQPYFRIFNPWLQQKKFDPQCDYIHQWVPELAGIAPQVIHNGFKARISPDYPAPIVDHGIESKKAVARYRQVVDRLA